MSSFECLPKGGDSSDNRLELGHLATVAREPLTVFLTLTLALALGLDPKPSS